VRQAGSENLTKVDIAVAIEKGTSGLSRERQSNIDSVLPPMAPSDNGIALDKFGKKNNK